MNSQPSLVFFGNERIATGLASDCPILRRLIAEGYKIEAIVTSHEEALSRKGRVLEVKEVAERYGVPIYFPSSSQELIELSKSFTSEIAVLVAYGRMVPETVIQQFARGIVNIHPSLLPKHRGSTPLESVILEGETETGVSIMSLVKEMDAGPIYGQTHLVLNGTESKAELANQLVHDGLELLISLLPHIIDGSVQPTEQDHTQATYDERISKADGTIDWQKPARQLEREIRAYAMWPKSRTMINGIECVVTAAHVSATNGTNNPGSVTVSEVKELTIACGEDALTIERLIPAGRKEMSAADFIRGYLR